MKLITLIYVFVSSVCFVQAQTASYRQYLGTNSQGLHDYGTATPFFPNNLVADDFGPRQLNRTQTNNGVTTIIHDPYNWHGGIDFNGPNPDVGDLILAIEGGTVHSSGVNTGGFKWISVIGAHNISYEHIGTDGLINGAGLLVGGCRIKHLDSPPDHPVDDWAIIFQINGAYNAIGSINNASVTFKDEHGVSRTLVVHNTVAAGQPIAPLGGSGHYEPHAHIQGMSALSANGNILNPGISDAYAKNPLEYIAHISPTFSINLTQQNVGSGLSPVYPGSISTPLKALVTLTGETNGSRYANSIMDIDKVEFKISKLNQANWQNIKGPQTDGIHFGGKVMPATTIKPDKLRTQGVGSWTLTGVNPYTYYNHKL